MSCTTFSERAQAQPRALKLLGPAARPVPNLPSMVRMTEKAFQLSEATRNTPVMMVSCARRRPCYGRVRCAYNKPGSRATGGSPNRPSTITIRISFAHNRPLQPAHQASSRSGAPWRAAAPRPPSLNGSDGFPRRSDLGIIVQGRHHQRDDARAPHWSSVGRSSQRFCLPISSPRAPDQIAHFCKAQARAVPAVEEGAPDYIEQASTVFAQALTSIRKSTARMCCRWPAEYTAEAVDAGPVKFFAESAVNVDLARPRERFEARCG